MKTSSSATANLSLVAVIWIVIVLGCSAPPSSPSSSSSAPGSTPPPATLVVEASALVKAYEDNEVAADNLYKGKFLEITGTINTIGKDILDDMYVSLRSGRELEIFGVQCFFAEEHKSQLAALKKGQQVKIIGRCDGKFGNILIKDARLK